MDLRRFNNSIRDQVVSGTAWRERHAAHATFAVMTKRGFVMNGSFTKEYRTAEAAAADMNPGDQVVAFPISVTSNV